MTVSAKFRFRIYNDALIAIGPGKVDLLEAIASTGSISGAARAMNMSYRRAWLLVEEMNKTLIEPVVSTATGGTKGGGARLTSTGERVIHHYRSLESRAEQAAAEDIGALTDLLRSDPPADTP